MERWSTVYLFACDGGFGLHQHLGADEASDLHHGRGSTNGPKDLTVSPPDLPLPFGYLVLPTKGHDIIMALAVSRVKRTQVYLDPVEHEALKRKAAEEGVSMSELLRRIVREQLGLGKQRGSPAERLMRLVAIGESGLSDVSERHDEYLARALRREAERR